MRSKSEYGQPTSSFTQRRTAAIPAASSASFALFVYARSSPPVPSRTPPKYRVTTHTTLVTFSRWKDRLSGGALRLAVVAVALRAAAQDIAPAVVPRVIVLFLHLVYEVARGVLCLDKAHMAEKARTLFDKFSLAASGRHEILAQSSQSSLGSV